MSILQKILKERRADIEKKKNNLSEQLMWRHARGMLTAPDFKAAVCRNAGTEQKQPALIAELKKASPSAGVIRDDFPLVSLARELEAGGADALSVLTEPHFFQGSTRYIRIVSDNVEIPVLCKDFIIDSYQIAEARAYGASAVLLIAAALDGESLSRLLRIAGELQMEALVEVHNEEELERACESGAEIIGVNSRDLTTFVTDLQRSVELLAKVPGGIVKVAESGIESEDDVTPFQQAGADAVLVGSSIMKSPSPREKAAELTGS